MDGKHFERGKQFLFVYAFPKCLSQDFVISNKWIHSIEIAFVEIALVRERRKTPRFFLPDTSSLTHQMCPKCFAHNRLDKKFPVFIVKIKNG